MPLNQHRRHFLLGCGALAALPQLAFSQSGFPSRPIRFIVPYPPGGIADLMARLVQSKMQPILGQPVVVENRTGAGGNIGTDFVAKAAPDGYTILLSTSGPLAVNKALYQSTLSFDPDRDLRGVIQLGAFPLLLVANPGKVPAKNAAEFIAWLKAGPESRRTYASAGSGTPQHLAGELFARATGIHLLHIPYKGAGPALIDVMTGQVPFMFEIAAGAISHVQTGRLKALGVTSATRMPTMPEVPTLAESGVTGFEFTSWNGISAPKATPDNVIQTLNRALQQALADPELQAKWTEFGSLMPSGPASNFDALVSADSVRLGNVVRAAGIKPD